MRQTCVQGTGCDTIERPLKRIERNIERCDAIINDLLDFSRTRDFHLQATDIDRWLAEVIDAYALPEGIRQDRKLAAGLGTAIDRHWLAGAIGKLFDNACQAMTDPDWQPRGRHRKVLTIESAAAPPWLEIAIVDSGPGIPEDVLPQVFEPLYSTKSFGVGLGLPTVKQIVEQHGGEVEVLRGEAGGTRAVIRLSLEGRPAMQQTDAPRRRRTSRRRRLPAGLVPGMAFGA